MNQEQAAIQYWEDKFKHQADYIAQLEKGLESSIAMNKAQSERQVKELTDFEIKGVMALDECWIGEDCSVPNMIAFAKAILRKAQEK